MALIRPVYSSHCWTGFAMTWATPTSGGGGCPPLLACSLLQPAAVSSNATSHGVDRTLSMMYLLE
jgi:hypothetical protein